MAARLAWVLQKKTKLYSAFSKYFPVHGLRWRQYSSSTTRPGNITLKEHLISRIKASGPLTVAAFMQEVLTNPLSVS
ncbi:protein arginine methyltransferase NDUFAF7, mitochondrial-like [Orbicella faveolata]|uniref:protein arginine methyltransferase NDUFAF7, mitochondrial-like n=1 Tax=Orbicella faveolata TaxID=48498 RepID=UPI0009E20A0E|nr:protein arginine methyltransferase NDUFAF7, mitochondrial-like [Orbicella faveolata]